MHSNRGLSSEALQLPREAQIGELFADQGPHEPAGAIVQRPGASGAAASSSGAKPPAAGGGAACDPVRRRLAQHGVSQASERDGAGNKPLVYAAHDGDLEAAFALVVQHGADVNCRDMVGRTVLMIAARAGHADVVRMLLQHGADPEVKDWESAATALRMAGPGNFLQTTLFLWIKD